MAISTRNRRRFWALSIATIAAAAVAFLAIFLSRPPTHPIRQPDQAAATISKPAAKPGVVPTVLLTSELKPPLSPASPVFRSAGSGSPPPKSDGAIVSLDDAMATVNLGSIDGLAQGTELPIVRGQPIGSIVIDTVFRDHARGKIQASVAVRAGDQVRVPGAVHLNAILQQVDSLAASGDLNAARDAARQAISAGSPGETRALLERLAALDYRSGAADLARERYEVAIENFDQPPAAAPAERAATLASLGALSLLSGDRQESAVLLERARAAATNPDLLSEILNNLGAIAELRGDRTQAATYYNQALTDLRSKPERNAVQANLARVSQHP